MEASNRSAQPAVQGRELRQQGERAEPAPRTPMPPPVAPSRASARQRPPVERLLAGAVLAPGRRRSAAAEQRSPRRARPRESSPPPAQREADPPARFDVAPNGQVEQVIAQQPDRAEAGEKCQACEGRGPGPERAAENQPGGERAADREDEQPVLRPLVQVHPWQAGSHDRHLLRTRPTPARTTRPAASATPSKVSASESGAFPVRPRGSGFIEAPATAASPRAPWQAPLRPVPRAPLEQVSARRLRFTVDFRRRGGPHAVGAVAVRAGGRAPVAAGERQEMTVREPGRRPGATRCGRRRTGAPPRACRARRISRRSGDGWQTRQPIFRDRALPWALAAYSQ